MTQIIKKWVKIILLDWEEEEIQEIQGRCTSGSVSIDGNAAVRRTCNLSMVVDDPQEISGDWAISKKIKVYIGIEENNSINWYKQGIFVITSFSAAESANNYTVSLTAQDKMCLLNGTLGGALYAETDFGNISTYKTIKNPEGDETTVEEKVELSIFDIIKEAVHDFGKEKYENIIIKDIEDALELIEYRGNGILLHHGNNLIQMDLSGTSSDLVFKPIDYYGLFIQISEDNYIPQYKFLPDKTYYIKVPPQKAKNGSPTKPSYIKLQDLSKKAIPLSNGEKYNITEDDFEAFLQAEYEYLQETYGVVYTKQNENYSIAYELPRTEIYILEAGNTIYQYGDVIGYRPTALTYSEKDFILKPGESVGTLLEKIKNKFGIYEYFYDVDGRFVFQKKRTYINFQYNGFLNKNENSYNYSNDESEYIASYNDKKQIVSINNSPQIQNIKNDYSLWGTTKDKIPFHVRIGINRKPIEYISYKGIKYSTLENAVNYEPVTIKQLPWLMTSSELYYKDENNTLVPFTVDEIVADLGAEIDDSDNLIQAFIWILILIIVIALVAQAATTTTLEEGFLYRKVEQKIDYRELIYQMALDYYAYHLEPDFYAVIEHNNPWAKNGRTGFESFYADMKEFWPHLYKGDLTKKDLNNYILAGENKGWSKKILEPSSLIFWFELIDGDEKYWIENIGSRMKAETNSEITAIAYKDTPKFLFTMTEGDIPQDWKASNENIGKFGSGYTNINVPVDLAKDFVISSKHYSAMELAEQYLYSYTNLAETKSISIIPNYNLKPNHKIKLLNESYVIKRITIPLAYNGIMNLELTKIYNN